jgi:hypothetical protein
VPTRKAIRSSPPRASTGRAQRRAVGCWRFRAATAQRADDRGDREDDAEAEQHAVDHDVVVPRGALEGDEREAAHEILGLAAPVALERQDGGVVHLAHEAVADLDPAPGAEQRVLHQQRPVRHRLDVEVAGRGQRLVDLA